MSKDSPLKKRLKAVIMHFQRKRYTERTGEQKEQVNRKSGRTEKTGKQLKNRQTAD